MALFKPFDLNLTRKQNPSNYRIKEIDLSTARVNQEIQISGDFIAVLETSGTCKIRINEQISPSIDLRKIQTITTPYYRLYVTNSAQTTGLHKVVLLLGTNASFAFTERKSCIETIEFISNHILTQATGNITKIYNLAGFKNVQIYINGNKYYTVRLLEYAEDTAILAGVGAYTTSDVESVLGFVGSTTQPKYCKIIDHPLGAMEITIYNEDSADDLTYDIIIIGEK